MVSKKEGNSRGIGSRPWKGGNQCRLIKTVFLIVKGRILEEVFADD
ncbi:hypothetical protein [Caldicellulosiruptor changbaiensis]|nr:hypothetical protein [Caldicellulosiruptor changbaiensis]